MSDRAVPILKEARAISFNMPSRIGLLDSVVHTCELELKAFSACELFNVTIVLRELLSNAIVYGNKCSPGRRVRVHVQCLSDREFKISVADEGCGFDCKSLNADIPEDPARLGKRGYILIGNISHAVLFSSKGRCVTAWVGVDEQSEFDWVDKPNRHGRGSKEDERSSSYV